MRRPKVPAPPDPGIVPGGIRERALAALAARRVTLIKQTAVEPRYTILTFKIAQPHLLRPHLTLLVKHNGAAAVVVNAGYFVSEAAALQLHDSLAKSITTQERFSDWA